MRSLAVMFADISGSTRLYEQIGDTAAREIIAHAITVLTDKVKRNGGCLIKTIGDEVMASFPTVKSAHDAAIAMQEANLGHGLRMRVGFHWGHVIEENNDVFGDTVNVAARITGLATSGEILLSEETVAELPPNLKDNVNFLDSASVKGKITPVQVYKLTWGDSEDATIMTSHAPVRASQAKGLRLKHRGREIFLNEETVGFILGRDPTCELSVMVDLASRRHARIDYSNGKYMITDQSTNGTFISGGSSGVQYLKREATHLPFKGTISLGCEPGRYKDDDISFWME